MNTGAGSHSSGIFATYRSNPGLPHCRILYHQSPRGSPRGHRGSSIYCHGKLVTLSPTASSAAVIWVVCQLPCGFAVNSRPVPSSTKAWM